MLRKSIRLATGMSNEEITLSRTEEGRPYVKGLNGLDVNVSHHGDWVRIKSYLMHLHNFMSQ